MNSQCCKKFKCCGNKITISWLIFSKITISWLIYSKITISWLIYSKITISWLIFSRIIYVYIFCVRLKKNSDVSRLRKI